MKLNSPTLSAWWSQDRKSSVFVVSLAALTLILIMVFHDQAVQNRMMLSLYLIGITVVACVLVRKRALALMELVIFAAVVRILAGVYFSARPGITDPVLAILSDLVFWFVLLYLGWRLAIEAYRFQEEGIQRQVKREIDAKATNMRGTALVTTSRELRQPLAIIHTITDALLNEPPESLDGQQQDSLEDMDRCVSHLMILIDNLFDYGQAEAGMIQLCCEPVTLPELIDQCVATIQPRAAQGGVAIHPHVDSEIGEITADPIRLKQIIYTLLYNAVDFNKEGGVVNLQVRVHDPDVLISVRDTGKGISNEEMEALFDPYRESTQDDQRIHASLGLSLTKRLVEMHGGTMTADSVADSGSIFTVRLPIAGPPPTPHQASQPSEQIEQSLEHPTQPHPDSLAWDRKSPKPRREKASSIHDPEAEDAPDETTRVLVADGNASVRRILRGWLSSMQCEMIEATNGPEALELARSRPTPHMVLLDAKLAERDGYEVCHALKNDSRLQLIPVILATLANNAEEKTRAFEAGADDFLVKPINRSELTVRLRSLLRIYRFNQELIGAESVAMALARAVAAKDGYSQGHVGKVADHAVMLGERLQLDVAELKILKYGAILHNVGKISIPDAVLEKQGPLSPREMAIFHQHPEIGCDICAPLKPLKPVLSIIRHHKEHWDGSGYPDRLKGDEIPLGAQIVGIVDAYTALISNRPYRRALPHDEAISILHKQVRDGFYNPELLDHFIECLEATDRDSEPAEHNEVLDEAETPAVEEVS